MKTVIVDAKNLRTGDVLVNDNKKNQRIGAKHTFSRRERDGLTGIDGSIDKNSLIGVLVIAPNSSGYGLDTIKFKGSDKVKVKRPIYNMRYRRAK